MRRVDPLVEQAPQRATRRGLPEHVGPVTQQLPDPVDVIRAIGHRRRTIGEHLPGRMGPRPAVSIRQCPRDLRRQSLPALSSGHRTLEPAGLIHWEHATSASGQYHPVVAVRRRVPDPAFIRHALGLRVGPVAPVEAELAFRYLLLTPFWGDIDSGEG